MSFNQSAIDKLIGNISSGAKKLGVFQQVFTHEPKSKPQRDVSLGFWVSDIRPSKIYSGLAETAGVVTFMHRVYINFLYKPEDALEGKLLNAVSLLIGEYSSEFSFGATVINVDLLGADSGGLTARTGYVSIDNTNFRTADINVPVIIDNLWTQGA
jgi:hypothetical protein